jgi:ABC-type sulfate/molybdate transport systems ATPase subunit
MGGSGMGKSTILRMIGGLQADMGRFRPYSSQLNERPLIGHCQKRSLFFLFPIGHRIAMFWPVSPPTESGLG